MGGFQYRTVHKRRTTVEHITAATVRKRRSLYLRNRNQVGAFVKHKSV